MDAHQKAAAFDAMVATICEFGDRQFRGTNARFVVVAWIDGHCDSEEAVAVGAPPEAADEACQALAFAAAWARANFPGQA